jgi:GT2 family glycosyltransferase
VAVVSWNTRDLLAGCLDSLLEDATSGFADVWVLDNASSDGSADLVAGHFPWVSLIRSDTNLGFGAAVNVIARRTLTPWISPANADTRITPGALRALVSEGMRHPEAGVIAPRLILPDGSTQVSAYPFPTVLFTLAHVSGLLAFNRRLAQHWSIGQGIDPEIEREIPWAVGAFLVVRRTAWDQVGGFDEIQWMYAEDMDLGWRLKNAGWRARYAPQAKILHHESAATSLAWGESRHDRWHASTYAWMCRRRGLLITRIVAGINVLGYRLRALLAVSAGLLRPGKYRDARETALGTARSHAVGLRPRDVLERIR